MLFQDVRYALRLLRRSPGFAATATVTLALSIGANAAIWSAVKGILIAPLPYADPDRLVRFFEETQRSPKWPMAPADFRDYRKELTTFDNIAAYIRADLQLGDVNQPEQLRGMRVTQGFFKLLGHPPRLGREFGPEDEIQGQGDKVILSHGLWMRRFDGDPDRSFARMVTRDPGFQPNGAITASVELPTAKYDTTASVEFFKRAAERIRALPGIQEATFTSDLPWTNYNENTGFDIVGRQFPEGESPGARYHFLTPGYTKATGTPLVAGRDVGPEDQKEAPQAVLINEAAARKYWPTPEAAVGARLNLWGAERTVAGVIGDVNDLPWHDRAAPAVYFPQAQRWYSQPMYLVARTDGDPTKTVGAIRKALKEIDPELPLANLRPLEAVAAGALATRRLTLWLVAAFGVTALLLAVVGVYGVMAQTVGQRRQEFGIRQALGATRADIVKLVFSSAAGMTLGGLAVGVALAAGSTRLLMSLLYGVTPLDLPTFAAVATVLVAAAAGAIYLPARRATRVSAMMALRAD